MKTAGELGKKKRMKLVPRATYIHSLRTVRHGSSSTSHSLRTVRHGSNSTSHSLRTVRHGSSSTSHSLRTVRHGSNSTSHSLRTVRHGSNSTSHFHCFRVRVRYLPPTEIKMVTISARVIQTNKED